MKPPFLILEAGLHGEDSLGYYVELLTSITARWTGWPRLVFKTQVWRGTASPWVQEIVRLHGREPLKSLSDNDLRNLAARCHDQGLGFAVTVHDTEAVAAVPSGIDWIKLGSFGAADPTLREAVQATSLPTIVSMGRAAPDILSEWPGGALLLPLECVSRYPANAPYAGKYPGYSCHAVPLLTEGFAVGAAKRGATAIEVHVSERPHRVRPLPGDMCVSLTSYMFMNLAEQVGTRWSAN